MPHVISITMDDIKRKVLNNLNAEFGKDINNLDKCYELEEKYRNRKEKIEQSVSLQHKLNISIGVF